MNMLQPTQYQSMFVPTNLDFMNQQIMARDAEYAQKEALIASAKDKYAQINTHASAAGYKEKVLGELENNLQGMIDEKHGDIGALDVRSLMNTIRSVHPKIQDITEYTKRAEEQRKAMAVAGIDLQKGLGDFESWQESGRGNYRVGKIADYQKYIQENYGDLKARLQEDGLFESDTDGFVSTTTDRGILKEEIEKYRLKMIDDLMLSADEGTGGMGASRPIAENIATAKADALYQGFTRNYQKEAAAVSGNRAVPAQAVSMGKFLLEAGGDKSFSKQLKKSFNARWIDRVWDMDRAENNIGTDANKNLSKSDNPIINMYEEAIYKQHPSLKGVQEAPLSNNSGKPGSVWTAQKELYKEELGAYETVDDYLKEKLNIDLDELGIKLVKNAEAMTGRGNRSFSNELKHQIESQLKGKVGKAEHKMIAHAIFTNFANNNTYYKNTMNDAINEASDNFVDPSNAFDFSSIDVSTAAGDKVYKGVNRFVESGIINAGQFNFKNGKYEGSDAEDMVSSYASSKTTKNPRILGVGSGGQNGILFVVEDPDGIQNIASMDGVSDDMQSRMVLAMGRADILDDVKLNNVFKAIQNGDQIDGYTAVPYKVKGNRTVSLQNFDGSTLTVDQVRGVLEEMNEQLPQKEKLDLNKLWMEESDGNLPYQFKDPALMFDIIELLK